MQTINNGNSIFPLIVVLKTAHCRHFMNFCVIFEVSKTLKVNINQWLRNVCVDT